MQKQLVPQIKLRKFPYPYQAALAICSDLDGTKTAEKYLALQTFLNTDLETSMGPGLGLEVGNSFFPIAPDDSFSYLSSRPRERQIIRDLIHAGYVDCLHSFGDGAHSRQDVQRALDALQSDNCSLQVWVDHSSAPTNMGRDNTFGNGALSGASVYHADLTLAYGIQFAWMGRSTAIAGQETSLTLRAVAHVFDPAHIKGTGHNLLRDVAKLVAAQLGSKRFVIHQRNELFCPITLADSQQMYQIIRFTNHWYNPSIPDGAGVAYMLRPQVLQDLEASQGYMIFYTHLGAGEYCPLLSEASQMALRHLADEYRSGRIYVTTTARLLTHCRMQRYLDWFVQTGPDDHTSIHIGQLDDPVFGLSQPSLEMLQGLTFYVPDPQRTEVWIGQKQLKNVICNPQDVTGQSSIMIPRIDLEYPSTAVYTGASC